jgi:membrane-associated phospholipid phosphatase
MKHINALLLGSGFFFFLFIGFSVIVKMGIFAHPDIYLTTRLQLETPSSWDLFLSFFSNLGSVEISTAILLFLLGIQHKHKLPWQGWIFVLFLFFGGQGIEALSKTTFNHPSPPLILLRTRSFLSFPSSHLHFDSSYPSGHSFRIAFLYIIACAVLVSFKKIPLYLQVSGVSVLSICLTLTLYSRVSLGEHWASDVIGGALLAAAFGIAALLAFHFSKKKFISALEKKWF